MWTTFEKLFKKEFNKLDLENIYNFLLIPDEDSSRFIIIFIINLSVFLKLNYLYLIIFYKKIFNLS